MPRAPVGQFDELRSRCAGRFGSDRRSSMSRRGRCHPVGQFDELRDGELFGAKSEKKVFGAVKIGLQSGPQCVSQGFAPLPESR